MPPPRGRVLLPQLPFDPAKLEWLARTEHRGIGANKRVERVPPGFEPGDPVSPEVVEAIREAIDGLPELPRAVINGVFYEGLDIKELSRQHGKSRYYIYEALNVGLEAIRQALDVHLPARDVGTMPAAA